MNPNLRLYLVGWSVSWLVHRLAGSSVGHYIKTRQGSLLSFFYRSTYSLQDINDLIIVASDTK